jgi:membrane protein YdbS with pleckstrin-like domain
MPSDSQRVGTPATASARGVLRLDALPVELKPHPNLLIYYVATSFMLGPAFPALLIPRLIRFRTLRYRIDGEGVSVRWGALFRREITLNYARIQDLHLSSNVIERWLGLAKIRVQTASGGSAAEMTVEGILDVESLRDFLYSRMRGAKGQSPRVGDADVDGRSAAATEALAPILLAIADELRALREELPR